MRFILASIAAFLVLNLVFASQSLNEGYFLYNNLTVDAGDRIVVGVNASSTVALTVLNSSTFGSYIAGDQVSVLYNQTVGSGIYMINLGPGHYTIISKALRTTSIDVGVLSVPLDAGTLIGLSGESKYNFSLKNYSNVDVNLLSSSDYFGAPITANISDISTTINAGSNLDTLNLSLNRGQYVIALQSQRQMQIFVYVNSTSELVNPLSDTTPGSNYSVGVASYGLYNLSGKLYPYQVRTNEVIGVANITSLSSYETSPPANSSAYGSSLQLNVGLDTYVNGRHLVYWVQDVMDFNTSSNKYYLVDNIWNNTNTNATLDNNTFVGEGNVSVCSTCGNQGFYVDSYPAYYLNYSFPFNVKLIVLENQTPRGSEINFGYQVLKNGTYGVGPLIYFDNILLPGSTNTSLLTTPFYQTPARNSSFGNYYDTELVFGGESGGANAYFSQLNSSLWLYYNKSGEIVPFPSVYTFGLSTAESASGISVRNSSSGALVSTGTPNLATDIFAGNSLGSIASYISNTSNYTRAPTTTTVVSNPLRANGISPSEIGAFELLAGVAIVFILIVGFVLVRKH